MRKETATEVYALALSAVTNLTAILNALPADTTAEELATIKRGIGNSIGSIQIDLLRVITAQYPELDDLA